MLRLRVELLGVERPIWRRLEIPESYTFWDLHVAIQDAMGWQDSHLHAFRFVGSELTLGIPDDEGLDEVETRPDWETRVQDVLASHSPLALYEYDFGDSWLHEIRFEGAALAGRATRYPRCVGGERRCPPEDCGGPHGYEEFLRSLADPSDSEHESWLTWCGGSFDRDEFDPAAVVFQDPAKRWREVFQDAGA